MIVSFYDNNFNTLLDNASLNVGSYTLTRKAIECDECNVISEAFDTNINPTFLVLKNDLGRYYYSGFAGVPQLTKDNQTKCQMSDLKILLNNPIIFMKSTYAYVKDYFTALFSALNTQVIQNSFIAELDVSDISTIAMDSIYYPTIPDDYEQINVLDEMKGYLRYYDMCITSKLDIPNQKIVFYIKKINTKNYPLRTWEWNILNYGKWIASVNEAQAVVSVSGSLNYGTKYILTSSNVITNNTTLRDIYPIKRFVSLSSTEDSTELSSLLSQGTIDAISQLIDARYNENITIEVNNTPFEDADFGTSFSVYVVRGTIYKVLPVGEIIEKQDGTKSIKIGYKNDSIALLFV